MMSSAAEIRQRILVEVGEDYPLLLGMLVDLDRAIRAESRAAVAGELAKMHDESPDDPQQTPTYWDGWHAATDAAVAIAREKSDGDT